MTGPVRAIVCAALAVAAVGACTSTSVYESSRGFRRATCDREIDPARRAACLEVADRDAESYRREREAAARR
jgi:hypothetical protein